MVDLLHVLVLLELVDQFEHFGRFGFTELGRRGADVFVLGRDRRDAALLERLLQRAEILEQAAGDELRLALFAGALAELLETVVDQVELEVVLVDALGIQPEHAHASELEGDAARRREVTAVLVERVADRRHGARRVVRRAFDQHRDTVRRVTLIDDLFEVGSVATGGTLDCRVDLVLRHIHGTRVLDRAAQRGVRVRVGAALFHRDGDVLADAAELLCHAVPAREHRVLSDFENASHDCSINSGRAAGREGRAIYPSGESLARWNGARHEPLIIKNY